MKADLATREPEMLRKWEEIGLYEQIQTARAGGGTLCPARRPALCQRRRPHGHRAQQDPQGSGREIENDGRFSRALTCPGWDCHGLPIEYKVVKESRGLSPLEVRQRSEAFARKFIDIQRDAIQAPRRLRRLGASLSHDGSGLRSGNPARLRRLRGAGAGLRIDEAGLLEHRRADRPGRSRSGIPGPRRTPRSTSSFRS